MCHINRWIAAIAVLLNLFIGACATTPPQESTDTKCSPDGTECETLIAQIHFPMLAIDHTYYWVSPDSRRVAYLSKTGTKLSVVIDGKKENQYDNIWGADLIFSPDSKRLAYGARMGTKWCAVVDGEGGKQYDGVGEKIIFSPDSKHVAYLAAMRKKVSVVLDGEEGKQYYRLAAEPIIFDSSDSLHYLASKEDERGSYFYLVERTVK